MLSWIFFASIDALAKIQCTYDGDFFLLQKMSEYFFFFCWPGGMVVCCCCRQLPRKIGFLRAKNRGTEKKKLSSREPAIFSKVIVHKSRGELFLGNRIWNMGELGRQGSTENFCHSDISTYLTLESRFFLIFSWAKQLKNLSFCKLYHPHHTVD